MERHQTRLLAAFGTRSIFALKDGEGSPIGNMDVLKLLPLQPAKR